MFSSLKDYMDQSLAIKILNRTLSKYENTNLSYVEKEEKIYEEIKCLEPEDTLQLTLEADSEEQREFYQMVGDFLLQKKQKQVIARNLF